MHGAGTRILDRRARVRASAPARWAAASSTRSSRPSTTSPRSPTSPTGWATSGKLTFTAEYKTDDGTPTTVVQQPPKAGLHPARTAGSSSPRTPCWSAPARPGEKVVCQKSAVQGGTAVLRRPGRVPLGGGRRRLHQHRDGARPDDGGGGGARVSRICAENTATIGGQKSDCLDVTGIPQDAGRQAPADVSAKEFHVCVAESGLLTRFKGVGTDDKALGRRARRDRGRRSTRRRSSARRAPRSSRRPHRRQPGK